MPPKIIVGVDPSLAASAFVALRFDRAKVAVVAAETVKTEPETPIGARLFALGDGLQRFLKALDEPPRELAIEGFARGFTHHREEMGMATGVLRYALHDWDRGELTTIPIREAKKLVCPGWPGLCKANWTAAGYAKKYRASMPDKTAVMAALFKLYGVNAPDDHQADAACIAIAAAVRRGLLLAR